MIPRNACKYLIRAQTELPSIVSLGFLRYSYFTELQFKFTTTLLFHILDRDLIFCLVETSWCQSHIHHYRQTRPLYTSLPIQYVFMAYSSHLLRKEVLLWSKEIFVIMDLCFWERGEGKPPKPKIYTHRHYKVCTLDI